MLMHRGVPYWRGVHQLHINEVNLRESACGGLTVHMYAIRTAISHEPALSCQSKEPFPMDLKQFGSYDSLRHSYLESTLETF